jgi:hypothetical protein
VLLPADISVSLMSENVRTWLTRAPGNDCSLGGQWDYSAPAADSAPTYIRLCPETCAEVSGDSGVTVIIGYPCLD